MQRMLRTADLVDRQRMELGVSDMQTNHMAAIVVSDSDFRAVRRRVTDHGSE